MSDHLHCERIERWVDGEESLQGELLTDALAHLETCDACGALFADAQFLRERLQSYEAPRCPETVVDAIWDRIDRIEAALTIERDLPWWSPVMWARFLVPAAALGLVLFVLLETPSPREEMQTPQLAAQQSEESSQAPCDLDLNEIYRRLGIDPARSPYDEETICAAAEDVRTAMAVMGKAMSTTREVVGQETRGRMAETMRKGLGPGIGSPTIHAPGSEEGG